MCSLLRLKLQRCTLTQALLKGWTLSSLGALAANSRTPARSADQAAPRGPTASAPRQSAQRIASRTAAAVLCALPERSPRFWARFSRSRAVHVGLELLHRTKAQHSAKFVKQAVSPGSMIRLEALESKFCRGQPPAFLVRQVAPPSDFDSTAGFIWPCL